MKFSFLTAALGLIITNINGYQFQVNPTIGADETSKSAAAAIIDKRQNNLLSNLDLFWSPSCSSYDTTVQTFGGGAENGACFQFPRNVPAVRATFLRGGCSVTVYTDNHCSNGPQAVRINSCVSGEFKSFSTDTCS